MAPKIQAAIWYLENGGKHALITNPVNIGRALKGEAGTWIFKLTNKNNWSANDPVIF